jgi:hypothetical protein
MILGSMFIILRYTDGEISLTGWGIVWLLVLAAWIGILSNPPGK